ncbi:MAG TPA: hypothetical protein VFP54_10985 [Acidimicrobiales bacterium]|nr:hypothetical protein [Acidimicrobiales bacterium]
MEEAGTKRTKAATCGCAWAAQPFHDRLAGIEKLGVLDALELIGDLLLFETYEYGAWDPDDFTRFATEHNFTDPVRAGSVFRVLSDVSARAFLGRPGRQGRAA